MVKIHKLGFKSIDQPLYSLDLAPNDFSVSLEGQRFLINEEAITFVNSYFAEQSEQKYEALIMSIWETNKYYIRFYELSSHSSQKNPLSTINIPLPCLKLL